jgi:hypothetical protein
MDHKDKKQNNYKESDKNKDKNRRNQMMSRMKMNKISSKIHNHKLI